MRLSAYAEQGFAVCVLLWLSQALDILLYRRVAPILADCRSQLAVRQASAR
jgi:hypothetical protein